jgi:hypothetical protein
MKASHFVEKVCFSFFPRTLPVGAGKICLSLSPFCFARQISMMIFASSKLRDFHKTAPASAVLPHPTMNILAVKSNVLMLSSRLYIVFLTNAGCPGTIGLDEFGQFHEKTEHLHSRTAVAAVVSCRMVVEYTLVAVCRTLPNIDNIYISIVIMHSIVLLLLLCSRNDPGMKMYLCGIHSWI